MSAQNNKSLVSAAIGRFHKDERGTQSVETIILVAVAAVICVGIFWLWDKAGVGGGNGGMKGAIANLLTETFDFASGKIGSFFG